MLELSEERKEILAFLWIQERTLYRERKYPIVNKDWVMGKLWDLEHIYWRGTSDKGELAFILINKEGKEEFKTVSKMTEEEIEQVWTRQETDISGKMQKAKEIIAEVKKKRGKR